MLLPQSNSSGMQSSVNGRWVDYNSPEAVAQRAQLMQQRTAGTQQAQQAQQNTVQQFVQQADPFAGQRAQYQTQLNTMMANLAAQQAADAQARQVREDQEAGATALRNAELQRLMATAAEKADPFAGQRAQYATKLSDLLKGGGPEKITSLESLMAANPFFKDSMDAAQETARRRLAAMGMGVSGNAAIELQKIAQQGMSDEYYKLSDRNTDQYYRNADLYSGLSGAKADPAAGANALLETARLQESGRQFDVGARNDRDTNRSRDQFSMADLLGRFAGANQNPSAGADAGLGTMNYFEKQRQYENDNNPDQIWGGTRYSTKQKPLTLSGLNNYWGG